MSAVPATASFSMLAVLASVLAEVILVAVPFLLLFVLLALGHEQSRFMNLTTGSVGNAIVARSRSYASRVREQLLPSKDCSNATCCACCKL